MIKPFPKPKLPLRDATPMPDGLEEPEQKLWRELTDAYTFDDVGSQTMLRTGLEAHARARRCKAKIDAEGEQRLDRFQEPRPHALIASEREARGQWLQALKMLRLDIAPE